MNPSHRSEFFEWLVLTQIAPAFAKHGFLQSARVLVVPPLLGGSQRGKTIELLIFYSMHQGLDFDGAEQALVDGGQDPNLPPGVTNHSLYEPVTWGDSRHDAAAPRLGFCPAESFHGLSRCEQFGHYEDFEAFASYGSFVRGANGVECLKHDARLGADIDGIFQRRRAPS